MVRLPVMLLTRENTALVLDSSVDLAGAVPSHPRWRIVPQYVVFGDETFRDHVDLSPHEFIRRAALSPELPTTAHPSPGEFEAVYRGLLGVDRILAVVVSAGLSGTYDSALLGADARTVAIDSGTISGAARLLAESIQRRLDRGTSDQEIEELARRHRHTARFVLALEGSAYLARGGRAGRIAAPAAEERPIIEIVGGRAVIIETARTRAAALAAVERVLADTSIDGPHLHMGVAHAGARLEASHLSERALELRPNAIFASPLELGPAVCAHTGPGAVGVYWVEDAD